MFWVEKLVDSMNVEKIIEKTLASLSNFQRVDRNLSDVGNWVKPLLK